MLHFDSVMFRDSAVQSPAPISHKKRPVALFIARLRQKNVSASSPGGHVQKPQEALRPEKLPPIFRKQTAFRWPQPVRKGVATHNASRILYITSRIPYPLNLPQTQWPELLK